MIERHLDLEALGGGGRQLAGDAAVDDLDVETLDGALQDLFEQRHGIAGAAEHGGRGGPDGEDPELLALSERGGPVRKRSRSGGNLPAFLGDGWQLGVGLGLRAGREAGELGKRQQGARPHHACDFCRSRHSETVAVSQSKLMPTTTTTVYTKKEQA